MKTKISAAVLTYNEEENIEGCLESVKWADEIVLVDEKSSDKTVEIAKKYTKKVFLVDHDPMFHKNKQIALDKCTGNWILQIDADEKVTVELQKEILSIMGKESFFSGYKVPRKSKIFGKYLEHTGWYPDYQIKFFKNGKAKYLCETVHEQLKVDGEIGTLANNLIHNHYNSVAQFIDRLNRYTTNDAEYLLGKKENILWVDALRFPADEFLKRFFYLEGYKDGLHGLVLSLLQAFSRLIVFAKVWEKQGFREYNSDKFRDEVMEYSKKVRHDWNYWIAATETDFVRKTVYKLKNKLFR
ncbi:glycosyltransferase family 2 protein [Candidatus Gottesmanbacteria bacterium]|nr:glycosyltransferase family 2 protein [Candidatus Gottesmanbacteria bacterium]